MSFLRSPGWVSSLSPAGTGQNTPPVGGMRVWFDGADGTSLFDATIGGSLVAPNGIVARWQDKSGNAMHFTQSTVGTRPTYEVNVKNGKSALRFGASASNWMASQDTLGGDDMTMITVCNASSQANYNYMVSYQDVDGAYESYLSSPSSPFNLTMFSSSDANGSYPSSSLTAGVINGGWNYNIYIRRRNDANGLIMRNNGIQIVSRASNNGPLPVRKLGCGAALFSTSVRMNGYLAEIIVYNFALSASELSATESYLAAKWAI